MPARKLRFFAAFFGIFASSVAFGAPPTKPASKTVAKKSSAKASASYVKAVRNWHAVEEGDKQPLDGQGRPELVLFSLNTRNKIALRAAGDRGGFSTRDLDSVSYVLREPSSGNQHPIDPALVDLVYRIQTHFGAPEIRVVSCYRTPRGRNASNHGRGRAMDIIVPGATDDAVAKFAREQGFVGVGIYPTSGFVHVDVRDRSYFWIDSSAPGRRNRERGVLGDLAKKSDAAAIARGERGVPSLSLGSVDALLKSSDASSTSSSMSDEEDEDTDAPPTAPAPE